MPANLSSIADMSSILYQRRARISEIADIPGMSKDNWKSRLIKGIEAQGKSQREVSLAAGRGPGYVNSLLKEGKDPTIENLILVCRAANLSLAYVLFGFEISRETEDIVRALESTSPERRNGLLQFLQNENETRHLPSHEATGPASD